MNVSKISYEEKCKKDGLNCVICLDPCKDPREINKCHHVFCRACIQQSFCSGIRTCPTCRTPFTMRNLFKCEERFKNIWREYGISKERQFNFEQTITRQTRETAREPQVFLTDVGHRIHSQTSYSGNKMNYLQEIVSSGRITLNHCLAMEKVTTSNDVYSTNTVFHGDIEAKVLHLANCQVGGKVVTKMGVIANETTFYNSIECKENCQLENSSAKDVSAKTFISEQMGRTVTIENIQAEQVIRLKNVKVLGELNSKGCIFGNSVFFQGATAQKDIEMTNFSAKSLKSFGKITASNTLSQSKIDHLQAYEGAFLNKVNATKVYVAKGGVKAKNCMIKQAFAEASSTFEKSSGEQIVVSNGTLKIENGCIFDHIHAEKSVELVNSQVKSAITACGPVVIKTSRTKNIRAHSKVELFASSCDFIQLIATKQKNSYKATLFLEEGVIQNGIKITLPIQPKIEFGNVLFGQNEHMHIQGVRPFSSLAFQLARPKKEGWQKIRVQDMEITINDDDADLIVKNVNYPLGKRVISEIKLWYQKRLKIFGGKIINTYGKRVQINDLVFGPEKKKKRKPQCDLFIQGKGTIQGEIQFIDCEGKIHCEKGVKLS